MPSALTPGTLHIVSTPIGNLEDVTYRAVRVLREVDLIAAEDTRRAARLLDHYGITTRRISLHEHNESRRTGGLLARLAEGQTMAMVSDAGTPLISDPGRRLARAALDAGFRVEAVPGASAVLAALVASGMVEDAFTFAGFPPARSKDRKQWYAEVASEPRPVVFFEAPHRIRASLADLETVSASRTVAVCREMTKLHESLVVGPIPDVLAGLQNPRGEFTVVLARAPVSGAPAEVPVGADLLREFWRLTESGLSRRASIRSLASKYDVPSRRVYQAIEGARGRH
ncbi:MAG: 16S rRNA (cytidine(1402)-2'-O)-methyltransferase [Acidobacteria bacterium]|nr:16S rRNA (cytidine(1402)-2'-O)-methyltransferase [Acidobacteriota bacterium]